jgi:membrane anchored protein
MTTPPKAKFMKRSLKLLRIAMVAAVAALALAIVPMASAASVDQIVQDAKDGQIDGAYSRADLNAALSSPLLKTYGGQNGVEAVKSALGSQTEGTSGSGELPFTGAEMITFVLIGSTLLVAGFVLRRTNRRDEIA